MLIALWLVTVWLLSLTAFVLLMGRRPKVAHPRPPMRRADAWEDVA